ncbi:MAG TPA: hypothetical protein VI588_04155, partial [Candidatus Gracilibacteria bacterium]|nr:hypothetical protein [Candidatus Gracilibacteria bacterium]
MKKIKITIGLIAASTALAMLMLANVSLAGVGAAVGPDCTEMLQPHNYGGNSSPPGSTSLYMKFFSEADCKSHAPYPNQHNAITAAQNATTYVLPQAATNEDAHLPWTDHDHIYVNNSTEDNFLYGAYVGAFEITLENDGVKNTTTSSMQCPVFSGQSGAIYTAFRNCVNNAHDPNHWGGIKLVRNDYSDRIVLRYNFGVDISSGKPWVPGYNPSYDLGHTPDVFGVDTNPESGRDFAMPDLDLVSKISPLLTYDNGNIWAATTTSRVLVRDRVLAKVNVLNYLNGSCAAGGWCFLEPTDTSIYGSGMQIEAVNGWNYYWVKIGTVSTVWEKLAPPPPPTCNSVNISPVGPLNENGLPQAFTIASSTSGGLNLHYRWTASQNGVVSFDGSTYNGTGIFDTTSPTNVARVNPGTPLSGNLILTINGVNATNHSQVFTGLCQKQVTIIPTPPPVCNFVNISPVGPLNENDLPEAFTITSSTSGGLQLDYQWTASQNGVVSFDGTTYNGTGIFDTNTSTNVARVNPATPLSGNLTLTINGVNKSNHSQVYTGLCQKQVVIQPTPPESCIDLDIVRGPVPGSDVPATLPVGSPTDNLYVDVQTNPPALVNQLDFDWTVTGGGNMSTDPTLTPGQLTSLTGGIAGTTVAVKAFNPAEPNKIINGCSDTFTLTGPKVCEDVTLTSSGGNPLDQNEASLLSASGTNTDNSPINFFSWTTTGGSFQKNDPNPWDIWACGNPAYTPNNYPAACELVFSGGPAGTVITATAVGSTGSACQEQITVQGPPPGGPACEYIELLEPDSGDLTPFDDTDLSVKVHFDDGNDYNTKVRWSGQFGNYNGLNPLDQTHSSS